ncbi:hypothetical protein [Mucisphaera sp.]|uniref:hypothetical protein n=1 Tax=Mucisphaera sp. TaxID=2913024 RepID=UPI003D144FB4
MANRIVTAVFVGVAVVAFCLISMILFYGYAVLFTPTTHFDIDPSISGLIEVIYDADAVSSRNKDGSLVLKIDASTIHIGPQIMSALTNGTRMTYQIGENEMQEHDGLMDHFHLLDIAGSGPDERLYFVVGNAIEARRARLRLIDSRLNRSRQ